MRVYELLPQPFGATSRLADTAGLGAQYPRSIETATDVLSSAILAKRLMPFTFKSETVNYLVADTSAVDFDSFLTFNAELTDFYASLPKADQVFGPPGDFIRELTPRELVNFSHIVGGIASQEHLLDTDRARRTLLRTLGNRGVPVITSTKVTSIRAGSGGQFSLELQRGNEISEVAEFDIVINAAGWGARELGQQIGDMPALKLLFRGSRFVAVDDATRAAYPYPFKVVDGMFMHFIPRREAGSIGLYTLQGGNRFDALWISEGKHMLVPDKWRSSLLRQTAPSDVEPVNGIDLARTMFMPKLGRAALIDMVPGVVIAFDEREYVKTQPAVGTVSGCPGYVRILPTKYTNALPLALSALNISLNNSCRKGALSKGSDYLDQICDGKFIDYVE